MIKSKTKKSKKFKIKRKSNVVSDIFKELTYDLVSDDENLDYNKDIARRKYIDFDLISKLPKLVKKPKLHPTMESKLDSNISMSKRGKKNKTLILNKLIKDDIGGRIIYYDYYKNRSNMMTKTIRQISEYENIAKSKSLKWTA